MATISTDRVPLLFQEVGGGIKSPLTFQNSTSLFSGNLASWSGGAIYAIDGTIKLLRNNTFMNNSADFSGGAMYGSSTDIEFHDNIIFSNNSADFGGAMNFKDVSLKILSGMILNTSFNNASIYGGAIWSVYISAIPILKIGNSAATAASPRLLHYCLKIQNPKILKH